jgi:hypothetical protein
MMYRTKALSHSGLGLPLALALLSLAAPRALAQSVQGYDSPPSAPAASAPAPAPIVAAPPAPQGQWVNTAQYGLVWVPAGASVVDVGGVPSVYLYTPSYGWSWYASPWGYGPFAYGAWVHGAWPFGFRVWRRSHYGWGWQYGPHVNVYVGPRYGHGYARYAYPHHHGYHGHHGHWGGHRHHH